MAASKSKAQSAVDTQDTPLIVEKSSKSRKPRKTKGKEDPPRVEASPEPSTSSNKVVADSAWSWTSLTDSAASNHPPVFTKDGSYFFSIVGSSVKIYASADGHLVSTLSAPQPGSSVSQGHKGLITSAFLNPHNPFQLITGSLDGLVQVWDFLEAILLQTVDIEQPILQMAAHEKFKNYVFAAVSRSTKKKNSNGNPIEDNAVVLKVSLNPTTATTQSPVQRSSDMTSIGKTRITAGLEFSSDGSWLVAIAGHKAYVVKTSDFKSGFTKFVSSDRLTCIAFHPTEEYFATGDTKGNIKLWYCLNDGTSSTAFGVEKRAQTTSLHWHAHAVSSIKFAPNGAYLLSGGEESVLVIWQLHTGKKEFVPRVGAPISNIAIRAASDKEEEYLLGLSDATYTFVSSGSLKISRSFSRIKLDSTLSYQGPSSSRFVPLATHPLTSTLILPSSHPSSLQTYSPASSTLLSEIEVSPSNRVSRRDEKQLDPPRIQHVAVSSSGEWMATVDDREADESFRAEVYLKVWQWDGKSGFWILNTRVDRPHGLKRISSISFSPRSTSEGLQLVTTGEDDQIKSWRLRTAKGKARKIEEYWVPRSSFGFRSESPSHASWSTDGSLLAVASGPYVPLYDPVTNALRQIVTCAECTHVVSSQFLGRSGRYLAIVGKRDVVLWDLIAQSVRWHHRSASEIDHVVAHPTDDSFALLQRSSPKSSDTRVLLFKPASAIPYKTHTIPFRLKNVIWYPTPLPHSTNFSLVGITEAWSVLLFGDDVKPPTDDGSSPSRICPDADAGSSNTSIFQQMFGISAFANGTSPLSMDFSVPLTSREGKRSALSIFNAPAYLMPPLESLFEPLIGSFLHLRTEVLDPSESRRNDAEDEDVQMDVDQDANPEEKPLLVGTRAERIVDGREMNDFVELFKHYGLTSTSSQRNNIPHTHSNGINKRNGVAKHASNGIPSTPIHKSNGKTPTPTPQKVDIVPTPSPPTTIGKKRKKSLGEAP